MQEHAKKETQMKRNPGRSLVLFLALANVPAMPGITWAQQDYPARAVRLIVPSSPGGGTDTTARILSPKLADALGQQVVVDNRPGASTIIGMEAVTRSAPDGYTLLIGNSTMTIIPSTHKKLRVDPVKDFAAVSQVVELPQILVSHPSFPGKNLKELIAIAKQRPGEVDYAAGAYGGSGHMAMELLLHMAAIKVVYVPYKSGNAGLVDTLAGQVPLMMGSVLSALPHVRTGRLRAYGVTSPKRVSGATDIPTIAEAGVPGYQAIQWFGIFAPAGTPREITSRLHTVLANVLQDPAIRKQLINDGAEPRWSQSPDDFAAFVRSEVEKWAKVVRNAGIKQQ
jgi:tripartite-type tricarboxylate transporter receptor subunit TctC